MADSTLNNEWYVLRPTTEGESGVTEVETEPTVAEPEEGVAQLEAAKVAGVKAEGTEDEYLEVDFSDEEETEEVVYVDDESGEGEEENIEFDLESFKAALLENEDLAFILETIGIEDLFKEIDEDGDDIVTTDEIRKIGDNIYSLKDLTIEDILNFAKENGLPVPDDEDLEDIDLTQQALSDETISELGGRGEATSEENGQTEPIEEETLTPETASEASEEGGTYPTESAAPYSTGSYGGGGGGYSNYGGGTGGVNNGGTGNKEVDVPEENKSIDELTNTVRPEKEKTLQEAKDKLNVLENDGGELAQYKDAMENAYQDYSDSIREVNGELSDAMDAKHEEINKQENLITQKEADIANQEITISGYEAELSNLNASKSALETNKKQLEGLNLADIDPAKQAKLQTSIATLTQEIGTLETKIKNTEEKLEKAKTELNDMKTGKDDSLDALQAQLEVLKGNEPGQLGDLQKQIDTLMETNPEIKDAYDAYISQKDTYESKKSELIEAAKSEIKSAQEALIKTDGIINQKQIEEANKTYSTKKFTQPDLFDPDIKLSIQEINDGQSLPYVLIGPENADPNEELPVLVYLHGRGQVGTSLANLQNHQYDPAVIMQEWDLSNFNGYIICPRLDYGSWNTAHGEQELRKLYENFSSTHAVNKDKVAVGGASLGAQGSLYMANAMSDIFCKAVAFSPYNPGNLGNGMNIPTKAFVGSNDDRNSINFANGTLKNLIGSDNYYVLNGEWHDSCPGAAFNLDSDGNGCSDVLEWLFLD